MQQVRISGQRLGVLRLQGWEVSLHSSAGLLGLASELLLVGMHQAPLHIIDAAVLAAQAVHSTALHCSWSRSAGAHGSKAAGAVPGRLLTCLASMQAGLTQMRPWCSWWVLAGICLMCWRQEARSPGHRQWQAGCPVTAAGLPPGTQHRLAGQ